MSKKQSQKSDRLSLTVDYAFKRVFGKNGNESMLKDFLEAILDISIEKIEIQNPEIPKDMKDSKIGTLDIKAQINENQLIDIEMQVQDQYNIDKRSTQYLTKMYADQLKEGETYQQTKRVIAINILNFNYYKRNTYHSIARMKFEEIEPNKYVDMGYKEEDQIATRDIEMHFIELPKFKKKNPNVNSRLEQWLWVLSGEKEKIEVAKKKNEEVKKAEDELERLSQDRQERELYELRLKAIRDEQNIMLTGIERGIERGRKQGIEFGRKQGIEQGLKKKSIEIARNMLKENIDIEIIIRTTGLTKEEIKKIEG